MDITLRLPNEILAQVLSARRLRPSQIATARLACRRWGGVGGGVLARERSRMLAKACAPGGLCAHQWAATAALVAALVDDNVAALLRVLDTDMIGPDDPVVSDGWSRLKVGATTTQLASVSLHTDGGASFDSFALWATGDVDITITSLVVTPLAMAFAYGALRCARVLVDRGARPMPHVDALVSFLVDRFACHRARAVEPQPGYRWYNGNVVIAEARPDQPTTADVLAMVLETFPRGRRTPSGIVPPLTALAMAVTRADDAHMGDLPAQGVDRDSLVRDVVQIARVLLGAGYDPRAHWRCRGPYETSRMSIDSPFGFSRNPRLEGAARLSAIENSAFKTPCDDAALAADWLRSHYNGTPDALDALAKVYADHGTPRVVDEASRDRAP